MAEGGLVQGTALENERKELERELWERDRKISLLSKSKEDLAEQVQQLTAIVKDAHTRYEDDLQLTVASLQDKYNAAVELLQFGAGLNAPTVGAHRRTTTSGLPLPLKSEGSSAPSAQFAALLPGGSDSRAADPRPSAQARPRHTQDPGLQPAQPQPQHATQARRPCCAAGSCRCAARAAPLANPTISAQPQAAAAVVNAFPAGAKTAAARPRAVDPDPRFALLGLNPDDLGPSAAFGASVGLLTEPLAVLRDVLNLDGAQDREREQMLMRDRPLAPAGGIVGIHGPMLAQAQFEARLRGAYRSMLMQLQHRYQLEKERQEDVHKLELQDQEERHTQMVRELTARHEAELEDAGRRLDQETAARRADVQRLEAHLAAARGAAETSQSQAAAARTAAEALQAQLQLLRTTHEAELQHVRQGSIPLQQHEEVIKRLKSEWEAALKQRETDFGTLMTELVGLRRQLSSVAEPSRSSGHSCGRGSGSVSRPDAAAAAAEQRSAAGSSPPPPTRAPAARRAASSSSGGRAAASHDTAHQPRRQHPHPYAARAVDQSPDREPPASAAPPGAYGGDAIHRSVSLGGGAGGTGPRPATASRMAGGVPGSPAGSGYSVALSLDEQGSAILEVSEETAATPHSRAYPLPVHGGGAGADASSRPPSAASSRLSDLVNAIVYGSTAHGAGGSTASAAVRDDAGSNAPGFSAAAAAGMSSGLKGGNAGASAGGCGRGGSFAGWLPAEVQAWTGSANGAGAGPTDVYSGAIGGFTAGDGGTDRSGRRPGSAEQNSSEVTFDRWRAEGPRPGSSDGPGRPGGGSVSFEYSGDIAPAARPRYPPRSPSPERPPRLEGWPHHGLQQQQEQQPWAFLGGDAAQAGGAVASRGGDRSSSSRLPGSRSSSPTSPPQQQQQQRSAERGVGSAGTDGESGAFGGGGGGVAGMPGLMMAGKPALGSSGHAATASTGLRCLRCGLNDATSPGVCRFHPALLADPGSLRFTPEWMTCHAADHTARTPGCFVRSEHFYDPSAAAAAAALAAKQPRAGAQGPGLRPGASSRGSPPRAGLGPSTGAGAAPRGVDWGNGSGVGDVRSSEATAVPAGARGAESGVRRVAWGGVVNSSPPRQGPAQLRAGVAAGPSSVSGPGSGVRTGPGTGTGAGPGGVGGKVYVAPRARVGSPARGPFVRDVVAAATAAVSGENSPSPKPRTRLPSPLRR